MYLNARDYSIGGLRAASDATLIKVRLTSRTSRDFMKLARRASSALMISVNIGNCLAVVAIANKPVAT